MTFEEELHRVIDGLAGHVRKVIEETREASAADARQEGRARLEGLVASIRAIDEARSLSQILDALAEGAARHAASVALVVVRGGGVRSWRLVGFGEGIDRAPSFEMPLSEAGLIQQAVGSGRPVRADRAKASSALGFASSLRPGPAPLALPILVSGQVVAALYGDEPDGEPLVWHAALEILSRHAARALEAVTAFRSATMLTVPAETRTNLEVRS
ncbi:MAG: GAF domain-containing protein [Acidobacteria bacterium]|nr:GAF domain-containing protein [Acidobacteriota bacterium]